jgi:hypothetical protein
VPNTMSRDFLFMIDLHRNQTAEAPFSEKEPT